MTIALIHAGRQLLSHLRAHPQPAPAWLTPAEAALFERMAPADQVEGLGVAGLLEIWGYRADRGLIVAGLLHDVGKSLAPASPRYRMAITALEALGRPAVPALIRRGGPLAALWNHAGLGADMAAAAGMDADAVRLIRDHHALSHDARLQALQRADARY